MFSIDEDLDHVDTNFALLSHRLSERPWAISNLAETAGRIDVAGSRTEITAGGKQARADHATTFNGGTQGNIDFVSGTKTDRAGKT